MSPRHAMMKVSKLKAPFGLQSFLQKAAENSLTSATFDLHEGGQQTNILKDQLERILALAEELELEGFSESTEEKVSEIAKDLPEQNVSMNQNPWGNDLRS